MSVRPLTAFALACAVAASASAQTQPTTQPVSAGDFTSTMRTAKPGDVITTSFDKLDPAIPILPLAITPSADAARLVISDAPEYFRTGDGIACQETVQPGRVRFYTYHVPVPLEGKPRRVISMVENVSDKEATLTFAAHSEPAIGGDYNAIAKVAMVALLGEPKQATLTIPPGGHEICEQNDPVTKKDLLAHGLVDFVTDQQLRLTVAQVTATDDLQTDVKTIASLTKLDPTPVGTTPSGAGRGQFPTADFDVTLGADATYDTASGPAQVIVANGTTDHWIEGVDAITGRKSVNKGNYGVVYHMKLKWKSTDRRGLAVMMTSARFDSKWCGTVAAVVRVNDGKQPGGVIELPREAVRFRGIPQACVIQTFDAPANGEATIDLTYTPPGACCLPTPILLVPIDR